MFIYHLVTIEHKDSRKFFTVQAIDNDKYNITFQRIYDDRVHGGMVINERGMRQVAFWNQVKGSIGRFFESWLNQMKDEFYTPSRFDEYLFNKTADKTEEPDVNQIDHEIISRLSRIEDEIKKI